MLSGTQVGDGNQTEAGASVRVRLQDLTLAAHTLLPAPRLTTPRHHLPGTARATSGPFRPAAARLRQSRRMCSR